MFGEHAAGDGDGVTELDAEAQHAHPGEVALLRWVAAVAAAHLARELGLEAGDTPRAPVQAHAHRLQAQAARVRAVVEHQQVQVADQGPRRLRGRIDAHERALPVGLGVVSAQPHAEHVDRQAIVQAPAQAGAVVGVAGAVEVVAADMAPGPVVQAHASGVEPQAEAGARRQVQVALLQADGRRLVGRRGAAEVVGALQLDPRADVLEVEVAAQPEAEGRAGRAFAGTGQATEAGLDAAAERATDAQIGVDVQASFLAGQRVERRLRVARGLCRAVELAGVRRRGRQRRRQRQRQSQRQR